MCCRGCPYAVRVHRWRRGSSSPVVAGGAPHPAQPAGGEEDLERGGAARLPPGPWSPSPVDRRERRSRFPTDIVVDGGHVVVTGDQHPGRIAELLGQRPQQLGVLGVSEFAARRGSRPGPPALGGGSQRIELEYLDFVRRSRRGVPAAWGFSLTPGDRSAIKPGGAFSSAKLRPALVPSLVPGRASSPPWRSEPDVGLPEHHCGLSRSSWATSATVSWPLNASVPSGRPGGAALACW